MKAPILFLALIATLATVPAAFAAPKAKPATLEQLKKEALDASETFENAQDCEVKVQETREGITISIRDSRKTSASLDVTGESQIRLLIEAMDRDGSSAKTFVVKGEGSLRLVHADDAFD